MKDVIIGIDDRGLAEELRAAFRQRKVWLPVLVPAAALRGLLAVAQPPAVAVMAIDPHRTADRDFLASLRAVNRTTIFVGVGGIARGSRSIQGRLEIDVETLIPLPIDPFELMMRLQRIEGLSFGRRTKVPVA